MDRLYPSVEDFFASLDEGIKAVQGPLVDHPPADADKPALKSLLSVFIAATIQMDPASVAAAIGEKKDPEMNQKLLTVRMALLAAYNLGRQSRG